MGSARSPKNTILIAAGQRLSIQRCIQSLIHASQCRNTNCSLRSCQKLKRVLQHTKGCGGCPICKQFIALCGYHAKRCQENICPVPFCLLIKNKLQQQLVQQPLPPPPTSTAPVTPNSEQQSSTPQTPQPMPNQPQQLQPDMTPQQQGMPRRMPGNINPNAFQDLLCILKSPSFPQQKLQESRHLSIQRCIQSLIHACQCRNANCSLRSCQKLKRVLQHTMGCKRKTNGSCPVCKQLIALCCYHAKHCQENKCPVPFCLNIKHKLRQQHLRRSLCLMFKQAKQAKQATMPRRMPGNIDPKAFQELLRILKSPSFPQQKQQVRTILKSNPSMMVSFNKYMKAKKQAGQPQAQQQQSPQAMLGDPPGMQAMVAMQSGQVQRPGMPHQQQQPQQVGPQVMPPMGPQEQMMNAAHNGNPQLSRRQVLRQLQVQLNRQQAAMQIQLNQQQLIMQIQLNQRQAAMQLQLNQQQAAMQIQLNQQQAAMPQGHGQFPQQQQPGPTSYSQLPTQQQGGEGPMGQLPPMAQRGQPMGQLPPMAQRGQPGPSNSPGSNSSSRC